MLNAHRTSELILNTSLTPRRGTEDYIDPPGKCLWCLVPVVGLVDCDVFLVPQLCVIDAAFTGVENVVTNFDTHAHTSAAGPPLIDKCFYTGSGGTKYADTTGYDVDINVWKYFKMSWTASSGSGILSVHADFVAEGDVWSQAYQLDLLSSTYGSRQSFVDAVNAEVGQVATRTLLAGSTTGTPPGDLVAPGSLNLTHT